MFNFITIKRNKLFFILLSLFPISIVIGPSISMANTFLIIFLYLFFFFKHQHYKFLYYNKTLRLLCLLYIYLIFNTLISVNYEIGLNRNLGFIRLILLFIGINYYFYISKKNFNFFTIWLIVLLVFVTDVYIERLSGTNIFGWGPAEIDGTLQPDGMRVVSFFKDEPIAGAYIMGFVFIMYGYLLSILKNDIYKKTLYFSLFFILLFSIILTGERSNSIKSIFCFFLFITIIDVIKLKSKIIFFVFLIISITLTILNSDYLKQRYFGQLYYEAFVVKDSKFFKENLYIKLYKSGYNVFANSPFLGVGNKNYRFETCNNDLEKIKKFNYLCSTHPHQIYFEFLSEHGLIGTAILLSIFFYLIFRNLKIIILSQNYIQIGSFVYLLSVFLPFVPSGSFFSDFNLTFFFINLSLLYAVNKDTNIFYVEKKY